MVKTSTDDLGFRAKIRDNVYPCKPQFYYIIMGCEGVQITQVCYLDKQHDICDLIIFIQSAEKFK